MDTTKVSYTRKQKAIEYKGNTYSIPSRKSSIETKLKEFSLDIQSGKFDEYETYEKIFTLFFTEEEVKLLLEDGEDSDLDELNAVVEAILHLYTFEKVQTEEKKLKETMKTIQPAINVINTIEQVNKLKKVN